MHLFAPSLDRWQGSLGEERHRAQPYCSAAGLIRAFIIIPITQVREPQRDEKDKALGVPLSRQVCLGLNGTQVSRLPPLTHPCQPPYSW